MSQGACVDADPKTWLAKAKASLVVRPYRPSVVYDVGADGKAVAVAIGVVPEDSLAVLSYPHTERFRGGDAGFQQMRGRSFVYDDALAVLWWTSVGDLDTARRVLQTLAALQRPDGAWGFGFAAEGDGFYNASYVRTGAVAWVVYAIAKYQFEAKDLRFAGPLAKACTWLLGQRDAKGLVRGGYGHWVGPDQFDPTFRATWMATEHQIDAWFALHAAADADPRLEKRLGLRLVALELSRAIEKHLWLGDEARYAQAALPEGTDRHSALDAAGTWSALYAIALGKPTRARQALDWVAQHHAIVIAGWRGLRPYLDQAPETWFVEGAVAETLAQWRLGNLDAARAGLQVFADLACEGGVPLVYSPVWQEDFPLSPAVAPTVWFLFAGAEIVDGADRFLWQERPPL